MNESAFIILNALNNDGTSYKVAVRFEDIRAVEDSGNNIVLYTTIPSAPIIKVRESWDDFGERISQATYPQA